MSWPVAVRGVTESVVTTLGPNDRWNVAALGLQVGGETGSRAGSGDHGCGEVTARTWGRTRTRLNFRERGGGYVQFTRDPVDFVEAALAVREESDPVLPGVDAWVEVDVERLDAGESGGTEWIDWRLIPLESGIERRTVPTTNRGYNAIVEATVAASRLDVPTYDTKTLRERLAYFETVVERCGGPEERTALERLRELTDA